MVISWPFFTSLPFMSHSTYLLNGRVKIDLRNSGDTKDSPIAAIVECVRFVARGMARQIETRYHAVAVEVESTRSKEGIDLHPVIKIYMGLDNVEPSSVLGSTTEQIIFALERLQLRRDCWSQRSSHQQFKLIRSPEGG
jgi:hypothetical protein